MGAKKCCSAYKIISVIFIPLLIFVGCSGTSSPQPDRIDSLEAFHEQVDIPEKLRIEIDFAQMSTLASVREYTAETMDLDHETIVRAFLKDQAVKESVWADGVTYVAERGDVTEALSAYDGGARFGTPSSAKGGFIYNKTIGDDDASKWGDVSSPDFRTPNSVTPYSNNLDYSSNTDLGFLPHAQAVDAILDVLHAADLPEFVMDETYSLDLATMRNHVEQARQQDIDRGTEIFAGMKPLTEWSAQDECYLFSFQQKIGELPVAAKGWSNPSAAPSTVFSDKMPITMVNLTYDCSGIRHLQAQNLLRIVAEGDRVDLISGYDALKIVVDHYAKIIIENEIRVLSAQLCYALYPASDKDFTFSLKPGWIFTSFSSSGEYASYTFDMVDAATGDLHPGKF